MEALVRLFSEHGIPARPRLLDETTSTQDEARALAAEGAPSGTCVVARYQSAGRGRFDRHWIAPAGTAVTMSVLLRPEIDARASAGIPMAAGLAVVEAVEGNESPPPSGRFGLKWPNDIVARAATGGRWLKLGGILAEMDRGVVIVGVGVNVRQEDEELPPGATSLRHLGIEVPSIEAVAAAIAARLIARVALIEAGDDPAAAWRDRLVTLGQPVVTHAAGGDVHAGTAVAVLDDGGLVIEDPAGVRVVVHAADVTLATPDGAGKP